MVKSKSFRTVSFVLAVLFMLISCAGALTAVFLYEENLLSADDELLEKSVMHKAAEYISADIADYCTTEYYKNQGDTDDYNWNDYYENQSERYNAKYSPQKSNIIFTVKTEDGETLLSTAEQNKDKNILYSFHLKNFSRDLGVYYTVNSEETGTYYPEEDFSFDEKAELSENTVSDTTVPEEKYENTFIPSSSDTDTPASDTNNSSDIPATSFADETTSFPDETSFGEADGIGVYIGEESLYNGSEKFLYFFVGEINQPILLHCRELYNSLSDEGYYYHGNSSGSDNENIYSVYFQDNYAISANGVPYFRGGTDATPFFSFFENSQNQNYDGDNNGFENDTGNAYTVLDFEISVLSKVKTKNAAKDLFYYAALLSKTVNAVRNRLISYTVISFIVSAVLFIFSLAGAGYSKNKDAAYAGGLHRIPMEIMIVLFATFGGLCIALIAEASDTEQFLILPGIELSMLVLFVFLEDLIVRLRSHTVRSSFFIVNALKAFFRWMKKIIRHFSDSIGIIWKIAAAYFAFFLCSLLVIIFIKEVKGFGIFLYIVFLLALLALAVYSAMCIQPLIKGAENISKGDTSQKISEKFLFGEFRKHAGTLNSISEGVDRAVEEKLRSESMKTELITNVSHDLKTPLTSIVNYVDLLKKCEIENVQAKEYIEVIDRQSQKLKKLTNDVVEASKASTGNINVNKEDVNLNVLMNQILGEYAERLSEASLTVSAAIPAEEIHATADARLLWRVFDNLLSNAVKYSLPGSRVYLSLTEKTDGKAEISLKNISKEELNISPAELTERFVRGDKSRSTEGSGLGLSIANSLINVMGGTFDIAIDGDLFKVTVTI